MHACPTMVLNQIIRRSCGLFNVASRRFVFLSRPRDALTTFKLSDIGEGISEVELVKWEKKVGDPVEEMEPVCTVQSDKAAVDITSRFDGIVRKLYVQQGETIKIGSPLMDIETEDAEPTPQPLEEKEKPKMAPQEPPKQFTRASASATSGIAASPAVRKHAQELGVDLASVKPADGKTFITREDVDRAAAASSSSAHKVVETPGSTLVPLKGIGIGMVKSMVASLEVPHVTVGEDLDMTEVLELYKRLKAKAKEKLTITPFILKALSLALSKHPKMNTKFAGNGYLQYDHHNISVAIATPNGLMVPNIKNVEKLSILEIQRELFRIQKAANDNKLSPADIQGGTCTLSNLGAIGGTYVAARLFDGQACIVALGASKLKPEYVTKDDQLVLEPRSIAPMGVTADHRHIDGATMALFAAEFKRTLQDVEELEKHF